MSIKSTAIQSFARFIVSGKLFDDVKHVVSIYNSANMTGTEKRHAVIKELGEMGTEVGSWAVNLAIELAVAYFKVLI